MFIKEDIYYKEIKTKKKFPCYHLDKMKENSLEELKQILEENGYKYLNDYRFTFDRGYQMKSTINFQKAKIIKNEKEVVKLISKFLLTHEIYENLESRRQMYFPKIQELYREEKRVKEYLDSISHLPNQPS